ncbi:MAG: hypothetical protein RLZZ71_2022 [Bacteroidota bacterium]|jgi:hypothetical protein
MKKKYCNPTITKVNLDTEMNLVLMSTPYGDPELQMMIESEETNGDVYSQFMNPLKWFK